MEIIREIKEVDSYREKTEGYCTAMEGFLVTTSEQTIFIGISNGQDCCEQFGYLCSEDNPEDFIGAELLNIRLTDVDRCSFDKEVGSIDEGGIMFVDLETSKGTFQIACYNSHNGYYGHSVCVRSKQLMHDDRL